MNSRFLQRQGSNTALGTSDGDVCHNYNCHELKGQSLMCLTMPGHAKLGQDFGSEPTDYGLMSTLFLFI